MPTPSPQSFAHTLSWGAGVRLQISKGFGLTCDREGKFTQYCPVLVLLKFTSLWKKNDSWLFMNSQSSQSSAPVGEGVSKTQEISETAGGWRVNKVTRCPLIHYTLNKFNFFLQKQIWKLTSVRKVLLHGHGYLLLVTNPHEITL